MVEELLKLKDMLDKGIITREEFTAAKEELAAKSRAVPLQRKPVSKSGFAPNSRPMHVPPKPSPKVQCPKCGEDMPTSRSYCDLCGAKLPKAEFSSRQANVVKRRWYVLPIVLIACIVLVGFFVSDFQKGKLRKTWVENFSERTAVSTSAVGESYATYAPSPTATKYLSSQGNPPKWILESIGDTIQNSMKDQDVTFWTSDSGVYITIGMPVNKSDFKLWAASSGRDQFDNFCTTLDELNASAWDVIVHQGYEDSAVVVIEVVDTPNGNLILSYLNGKQSYNFLED